MDDLINGLELRPRELEEILKTRFDYMWVTAENVAMWEFRFLVQLIEQDSDRFRINISVIANRHGSSRDLQHAAYLELNGLNGRLSLGWSSGVNHTLERAQAAFSTIYPLEQIVAEIREALMPYPVDVRMPESNAPLSPALSA